MIGESEGCDRTPPREMLRTAISRPEAALHRTGCWSVPEANADSHGLEFIELGIQSRKVEVYRSKDAQETVYNDTIPQDHGDFHLVVVGTRNPDYIH